MQAIKCELCGSGDIMKQDGFFVCQNCKTKYSAEEARKLIGTVKIDKTDEIGNLYTLARRAYKMGNFADAEKYYGMALLEQPNSAEACFFREVSKAMMAGIDTDLSFSEIFTNGILMVISIYRDPESNPGNGLSGTVHYILSFCSMQCRLTDEKKRKQAHYFLNTAIGNLANIYRCLEASLRGNFPDEKDLIRKTQEEYWEFLKKYKYYLPRIILKEDWKRLKTILKKARD